MPAKRPGRGPRPPRAPRSDCPIACTLDLLGDRWTLLVVRDLFRGCSRFSEFLESGEGIPTNILARRLADLERSGLITKAPYQSRPVRYAYRLTPLGRSLGPVLATVAEWGRAHAVPRRRKR